jgi:hypothetical protein
MLKYGSLATSGTDGGRNDGAANAAPLAASRDAASAARRNRLAKIRLKE